MAEGVVKGGICIPLQTFDCGMETTGEVTSTYTKTSEFVADVL